MSVNKLVRDKIPEIMWRKGEKPHVRVLEDAEYLHELNRKLLEECMEYEAEGDIHELVDIIEVVYAIAKVKGVSVEDLEQERQQKYIERGGFERRLFMR